jgi:hypothetical protein
MNIDMNGNRSMCVVAMRSTRRSTAWLAVTLALQQNRYMDVKVPRHAYSLDGAAIRKVNTRSSDTIIISSRPTMRPCGVDG